MKSNDPSKKEAALSGRFLFFLSHHAPFSRIQIASFFSILIPPWGSASIASPLDFPIPGKVPRSILLAGCIPQSSRRSGNLCSYTF